jgi:hypothetical protein
VIQKKQGKGGQFVYWPVYEYTADSGDLIQTRASSSGNLAENLPGTFRDVRVDPDNPYDVRGLVPAGMVFGIIFLIVGAGLFAISNSVNDNMGVVSLVAIALVGAMAVKTFITSKRDKPIARGRLKRKSLERQKKKRIPDLSKILSHEDHLAALRSRDASWRKWLPLVALVGAGVLAFGIWRGRDLVVLQSIGTRTEGTVVRIESETNSSSGESGYTYYSVVRFATAAGREVTFRDGVGSSHPIDERGEILGVLYDPGDLESAIIDRGIWNWAIPGGCGLLGGLTLLGSLSGLIGAFRRRGADWIPRGESTD